MAIVNGYASLAQVRAALDYNSGNTGDDGAIENAVEAASRQIDLYCDRRFWQDGSVVTREFHSENGYCVEVDDISTTTGLIVKIDEDGDGTFETTLTVGTDFLLLPTNAADLYPVAPFTELHTLDTYRFPRPGYGRPGVQVTAKFGWPAVPENVEQACIIQTAMILKSPNAALGVAAFGDLGGGLRVTSGLHPTAKSLLAGLNKPAVG